MGAFRSSRVAPHTIFLAAVCAGLACAGRVEDDTQVEDDTSEAQTHTVRASADSDSLATLIEALREVEGRFERSEPYGSWRFTGDRSILKAIIGFEERAVAPLVECLDRKEPTSVTVEGRRVPMGVMCYEALHLTVIYEPTTEDGGLDPDWPGHIDPTAQSEGLRAAKKAWQDVVARGAYSIP